MQMKGQEMIKNLLIAGSAAGFVLSTLFATIVFDRVSPNSTLADQEIEMAMAVQATDQHIEVFMDAILVVHTSVDIVNISKLDEEGNAEPGSIVDLFPVGSPAMGKGTIIFRVKTIPKSELPDLKNVTQVTVPMAFVKEETFNELAKSGVKFGAFMIKYFTYLGWMVVFGCIGMIAAGAGLLYLDKKMTEVEKMDPDEADADDE